MKVNLVKELKKMDEADFRELVMCINVGRKLRKIKYEFVLEDIDFAERFKVQIPEVQAMMNGAYPFDLKLVARIDAFEHELLEEEDEKFAEEQDIDENFADGSEEAADQTEIAEGEEVFENEELEEEEIFEDEDADAEVEEKKEEAPKKAATKKAATKKTPPKK